MFSEGGSLNCFSLCCVNGIIVSVQEVERSKEDVVVLINYE